MKIAVIGAGAMGCYFGGYLSLSNEVIFLDKNPVVVESISKNGIIVEEVDGYIKKFSNVAAYQSGFYKEKVDLIIVLVKTAYTMEAMRENLNLISDRTILLTLQNGAGNDRVLSNFIPLNHILIGTTTNNCVNVGNGRIKHSGNGKTTFGSTPFQYELLHKISEMFSACGLENEISENIQKILWKKLFVNLSINCFTALVQTKIGFMAENEFAWNFAKKIILEALQVARADGTDFNDEEILKYVHNVMIVQGDGYSSMYQDRMKKVKTEIDAINGAVVEQAKLYGIDTPYNSLVVDLIHAVEGTY